MGWWTDNRGNLVGDPTADVMGHALAGLAAAPIALAEFLRCLTTALAERRDLLHDPRALDHGAICARLADDTVIAASAASAATAPRPEAVAAIGAGLRAVASIFEAQFERRPTLGELLATVLFALDPERHLQGPGAPALRELHPERPLPAELANPPPRTRTPTAPFEREPGQQSLYIDALGPRAIAVRCAISDLTGTPFQDTLALVEGELPLLVLRDVSKRAARRAELALTAAGASVQIRDSRGGDGQSPHPASKFPETGSYLVFESGQRNVPIVRALRELCGSRIDLGGIVRLILEAPSLIPAPPARTPQEKMRVQALCDEIEAAGGRVRLVGSWEDLP